jgi:hypothetical protein
MKWEETGCPACFAVPLEICRDSAGRMMDHPHKRRVIAARGRDLCLWREGALAEQRKAAYESLRTAQQSIAERHAERAIAWRSIRLRHEAECLKCLRSEPGYPQFPPH